MSEKHAVGLSGKLIPVVLAAIVMALALPTFFALADEVVEFPDPNLEAAIRAAISKPSGDIYQSDLIELTELSAPNRGIADLTGMQYCTSLTTLYLDKNQINGIAPLSGLTKLENLWLHFNQISDLSPLSALTSLTVLILSDNQISDIEPLVNNPGLGSGDTVYLRINPLNSISVSTYIPELEDRGVTVLWNTYNQAPDQPSNVSPGPGATGVSLTPTLESSAFSDPDVADTHTASQWQMTKVSGDYSSPVFDSGTDSSNLISINVPAGKLIEGMTYYWQVRHQDNRGDWSVWSEETSFTIITTTAPNQPPDPPTHVSPADGATGVSLTPILQSSDFSDPDTGDTHAASQWQVTTSTGDYSPPLFGLASSTYLTSLTIFKGYLDYSTTYYWRVRHQDNHGVWSDWSEETTFATVAESADTTTPTTPDEDDLNRDNDTKGEVGGCCAPANAKASVSDLVIVWGMLGLCSGTGLLVARRLGGRGKKSGLRQSRDSQCEEPNG